MSMPAFQGTQKVGASFSASGIICSRWNRRSRKNYQHLWTRAAINPKELSSPLPTANIHNVSNRHGSYLEKTNSENVSKDKDKMVR